jgi:hypothetical protein
LERQLKLPNLCLGVSRISVQHRVVPCPKNPLCSTSLFPPSLASGHH